MSDHPEDHPEQEPAPFPTAPGFSPFPPLQSDPIAEASEDPPSDWNQGADAHDLPAREHPIAAPIAALGRFAFPPGPPPDEEGLAARDRRWTSRAIVFATVMLLVFNAVSLQNWARQQPACWIPETVGRLAEVWTEQVAQLGADIPRQSARDAYQRAQEQRFIGSADAPGT